MPGRAIPSVLFVCGRNAVRSPIAAALAERLYPGRLRASSAGVAPGEHDLFVDAVLAEIGIALGEHTPRALEALPDRDFDLAVTLSPAAHHKALEFMRAQAVPVEYWPTPDPTDAIGSREQILFAYRDLRDRLAARLRERFGDPAA